MDDFMKQLQAARKLSSEEEAKFAEIDLLYRDKGLAKNQRMCPKCLEILTSTHSHDFVRCSCGYMGIDGGDYIRISVFN